MAGGGGRGAVHSRGGSRFSGSRAVPSSVLEAAASTQPGGASHPMCCHLVSDFLDQRLGKERTPPREDLLRVTGLLWLQK